MKSIWKQKKQLLGDKQIVKIIKKASGIIREFGPRYILSDDRKRRFIYSIEIQSWVAKKLSEACIDAGVLKFAVISPEDILADLSTHQTSESIGFKKYSFKIFKTEREAEKWLKDFDNK
jgi:hypothetical protein